MADVVSVCFISLLFPNSEGLNDVKGLKKNILYGNKFFCSLSFVHFLNFTSDGTDNSLYLIEPLSHRSYL